MAHTGSAQIATVLAILFVAGGLVWPMIAHVREEQNRVQCRQNLGQIGLALHNFHYQNGKLPPAIGWLSSRDGPKPGKSDAYGNPFFFLLPYVGSDALYSLTRSDAADGATHAPWRANAYKQRRSIYVCPSDPTIGDGLSDFGHAYGSYAYNAQVFATVDTQGRLREWYGEARIPQTFQDGTSNTIVIAEKLAHCGEAGTLWANWDPDHWQPGFAIWRVGLSATYQPRESAIDLDLCDPLRASTSHSREIMTCLGDASVRRYSKADPQRESAQWWHMCTPAGGEVYSPADW
jgi:hypothetical protein